MDSTLLWGYFRLGCYIVAAVTGVAVILNLWSVRHRLARLLMVSAAVWVITVSLKAYNRIYILWTGSHHYPMRDPLLGLNALLLAIIPIGLWLVLRNGHGEE